MRPGHHANRSRRPHSLIGPRFDRKVSQVGAAPV